MQTDGASDCNNRYHGSRVKITLDVIASFAPGFTLRGYTHLMPSSEGRPAPLSAAPCAVARCSPYSRPARVAAGQPLRSWMS